MQSNGWSRKPNAGMNADVARIKQVTSKKTKTLALLGVWMLGMAASVHQCRSVGLPVHDSVRPSLVISLLAPF